MSYAISVWEQPSGVPFPTTWDELHLDHQARPGQNPKFLALSARLLERFPYDENREDDKRYWRDGSIDGRADDAVWNIGLDSRGPLDTVQAFVAVEATRLGLNMFDTRAGEAHFSNGTKLSLHERGYCVQALVDRDVYEDHVAALSGFRRVATEGNRFAQHSLGIMIWHGQGSAPNRVLGSALVALAGAADADSMRRELGREQQAAHDVLLASMQPAADLDVVIDAYLTDVDRRFDEGNDAARRNDVDTARERLVPLAEEGHLQAQMIVSLSTTKAAACRRTLPSRRSGRSAPPPQDRPKPSTG